MKFHYTGQTKRRYQSLGLLLIIMLISLPLASACGTGRTGTATVAPTLTVTATFPPTLTPTPEPLGTSANPFVIGLVSETGDPQMDAAAQELARQISAFGQVSVAGRVFSTYNQLLESMAGGDVHAAWLPPLTYLYASERDIADVVLLTNHFGVYQYGTQFMANVDSGFIPFFDPISGLSSADAATALEQFRGLRPCYVEPQSPSGYIFPAGLLQGNQISSQIAVLAQTHTAVVRALYIKGICDFGATFSISGDPRTASAVLDDLPDVMNRVLIIWRSDAVVPNLNLSLLASLSEGDRQVLTRAFLELGRSPEGRALLSLSANNYQIEEIKAVNDEIYEPLRQAAKALNLNLRESVGK